MKINGTCIANTLSDIGKFIALYFANNIKLRAHEWHMNSKLMANECPSHEQQMMNEMMPRSPVHASVTPKTKEETAH